MTERDLYSPFSHYIRDVWTHGSAVFELKICKEKRLQFSAVEEHQERALKMASTTGLYHKISDQSIGQKPFDCFYLRKIPAYLVICFYTRGQYPVYFIDIFEWIKYKNTAEMKSITEEECKKIAFEVGDLV